MNIQDIPNVIYAGEVVVGKAPKTATRHYHYEKKLSMVWNCNLPKGLLNKTLGIVYFMVVDGEIYKIGQTSGKGGIKACMNFYLSAGFGDDGLPRFIINGLWRECINKGKKVEVYFMYMEPVKVQVPGLFGSTEMEVPVSAKGMEENCLSQYKTIEGAYPAWNFQESGIPCPQHLFEAHSQYRSIRSKDRN